MLIHNAVLTGSLVLPSVLPITGSLIMTGSIGIGTVSPTARLHVSGTTGILLEADGVNAVNALIVSSSGFVGIGTATPSTLIHAHTTARSSGTNVDLITLSDTVTGVQSSGFGVRIVATSNNGQSKSAIAFEQNGGTNNDTAISFYTQFSAASLDRRMIIDRNGYVGIGTNGPATFLHVLGANTTGRGQLSIQSNNSSNAARVSFYYDTTLQGNIGTTGGDFYAESINTLVFLPGNGNTTRGGTIREFAGSVSPASPYTADLRLSITHSAWGGNNDSGTVYVEYQGRAYGNNQTTTAFGVITYRLDSNGLSITNVSTAGVTVSNVTISTDVSSNYILRITFGVTQNVDRASIFARTTNSFVSSISVDTV